MHVGRRHSHSIVERIDLQFLFKLPRKLTETVSPKIATQLTVHFLLDIYLFLVVFSSLLS